MAEIRQQQQQRKASKGSLQERIRQLDASLRARAQEQKAARARVPFRTADEVDRRIAQLEAQVDAGTMKLADEKRALAEASGLRKQRKVFAQLDDAERAMAADRAQLAELRRALDDPEARALSERYTALGAELDAARAAQDEAYRGVSALRAERARLHAAQQAAYAAMRAVKDRYYAQKKAFADYEHEAYKARRERQRAQREAHERERRKKVAEQLLEDASQPAFLDEILAVEGLLRYFDPAATTYLGSGPAAGAGAGAGNLAAQASRTVDSAEFKGARVVRKDDDNYFVGTGGKKGKRGRKNGAAGNASSTPAQPASAAGADTSTPAEAATTGGSAGGKFNLSVGVIEELGKVGVEPPMTQTDVSAVVDKLKAKLDKWKSDQDRQTKAVSALIIPTPSMPIYIFH
jgi:hypothetical protein